MTSAPKSLSSIEQYGPARMRDRSTTRMPSRGFTPARLTTRPCGGKCFPLQASHDPRVAAGNAVDGCASHTRPGTVQPGDERFLAEGAAVCHARPGRAG